MRLECFDRESVEISLSRILCIDVDELRSIVSAIPDEALDGFNGKRLLFDEFFSKVNYPKHKFQAVWCHATRARSQSTFWEKGILTKRNARGELYEFLSGLSKGLVRKGEYPNGLSVSGKQSINDEGPFASLFLPATLNPTGFIGNFCEMPELVADLSGSLLGGNYMKLVERFQALTSPLVVLFVGAANESCLRAALWFLHMIYHEYDEGEAAESANIYFDGKGAPILPEQILAIHNGIKFTLPPLGGSIDS